MTDTSDQALQHAVKAASSISEWANSPEGKNMLPYLLAGGGGALAGGLMTAKRRTHKGESRLGHLGRVLANAGLVGAGAAGASALASKGYEKLTGSAGAAAEGLTNKPKTDNRGPLAIGLEGLAFHPATAALAGATTLGLTDKNKFIGSGREKSTNALEALSSMTKTDAKKLVSNSPAENRDLPWVKQKPKKGKSPSGKKIRISQPPKFDPEILRRVHEARLITEDANQPTVRGALRRAWQVGTRGGSPLTTLGSSPLRVAGRTALGLTGALAPAVIGGMLTKGPEEEQ